MPKNHPKIYTKPPIGDKSQQIPRYSPVCSRGQPPGMAADKCISLVNIILESKILIFLDLILMYKVKYRLVPDFICDIFSTKSCKYNFRKQNFDILRFNSVLYGKHSLRYLGHFLWKKLDKSITETSSLSRFKDVCAKIF